MRCVSLHSRGDKTHVDSPQEPHEAQKDDAPIHRHEAEADDGSNRPDLVSSNNNGDGFLDITSALEFHSGCFHHTVIMLFQI